jgi:class 3 adenylate cyclase
MSKSQSELTALQNKTGWLLQKTLLFRLWETANFATGVASLEIKLEVGGFRKAAKSHHKNFNTNFRELSGQCKSAGTFLKISQEQKIEGKLYRDLHEFITKIEVKILKPLDKARKSKTEASAEKLLKVAFKWGKRLKAASERQMTIAIANLAGEICDAAVIKRQAIKDKRVVVSVDMARYGKMSHAVEGFFGADGIFKLNKEIRAVLLAAVKKSGVHPNKVFVVDTGDGALVVFANAKKAILFAQAVHEAGRDFNRPRSETDHHRHFRIGVSTGNIVLEEIATLNRNLSSISMGGKAIATAVRLQAAAATGEIVACEETLSDLTSEMRNAFPGDYEKVHGKAHEQKFPIKAKRYKVCDPSPDEVDNGSTNSHSTST